ncbi:MAG: phytanoyl-CoA dioxygenase family protein [Planctomycetes bacterium]|nr:phytanoyl-CoA dioxygenase family protein [Planctomycetota bacterium]
MTTDRSDTAAHRLSEARLADFERDGFVGPIPVLDAARLARVRAAVDGVIARLDELAPRLYEVERAYTERRDAVVCHFLGGWLVDDELRALVFALAATVPAAQVLGVERLRFWHDQVFAKPPGHPGVVPWHQDESYWTRVQPIRHVTVNLMLDDADEASGCLQFVPGSHRWELLPKLPFDSELEAVRALLPPARRAGFRPQPVPVPAGHATLHHARTLHGSGPNASARPRRAVVLNYMAADTRVAEAGAPLLRGVPELPVGALVEGAAFPIVLDLRAERASEPGA